MKISASPASTTCSSRATARPVATATIPDPRPPIAVPRSAVAPAADVLAALTRPRLPNLARRFHLIWTRRLAVATDGPTSYPEDLAAAAAGEIFLQLETTATIAADVAANVASAAPVVTGRPAHGNRRRAAAERKIPSVVDHHRLR